MNKKEIDNKKENNENKGMTLKQFVENWDYLIKQKKQYEQYEDIIDLGLDAITIICDNGIVIKADDYSVDYLFGNEWIDLYRKNEKIAVVRLSLINFMF